MPEIEWKEVRQDCVHFRGNIPCKPNKVSGAVCNSCTFYVPVSKRILIIKLGAIGDVIRTTPLIVKYRALYPDSHITWLTSFPDVLPKDQLNSILTPDAFSLLLIAGSMYDIAINLDKEAEACMLLSSVNAADKFGYSFAGNAIVPATPAAEHKLLTGVFDQVSMANTKSYVEEIFEICHFSFNHEPYLINRNEALCDQWSVKLTELAGEKNIVGLNTGCGPRWNTRLWPDESWMELARSLTAAGCFPVFLGGSLEHEKNQRMAAETGCFYPGHFSLEEFIALTSGCELIVTQVSMMMHIATALQKQMVLMNTIFNSHEFELYGRGEIISPESGCECYYGNTCKRGRSCMHDLLPVTVSSVVQRVLAKTAV